MDQLTYPFFKSVSGYCYNDPTGSDLPLKEVFLGEGIHQDQLILAEKRSDGWQIVLEENDAELARFPIDECGLMDIVLGEKWNWYHVEIRMVRSGLQIKVSGELFALLARGALMRLTSQRTF